MGLERLTKPCTRPLQSLPLLPRRVMACVRQEGSGKVPKRKTHSEIIAEFLKAHGDYYDYSEVMYKNSNTKVKVICPVHGEFMIAPGHHKNGVGCSKCYFDSQKTSKQEFVRRSQEAFEDRYDYSLFEELPPFGEKVTIKCLEHNDVFFQEPRNHMRGHTGCPKCLSNVLSGNSNQIGTFTTQSELNNSFIEKAKEVHGNTYDYSGFAYVNSNTPGKIICKTHGEFYQSPSNHLRGTQCPDCSIEKKKEQTFKRQCQKRGVDYCRALKRRQAGLSEEKIFNNEYIRSERAINEIKVFNEVYPNIEEAVRQLKPPASRATISRWIEEGISPEEAFERIPNPGYADGIIYLITNTITRLQYVGLTVQTLERRWMYHIEQATAGHIKSEESLHAAIREYGADKFTVKQIDRGTTKKGLELKERKWIKKLNTLIPNGYNISSGGVSGGSNKKPTEINGIKFNSVGIAAEYFAEEKGISLSAAKKRISEGRVNVKKPAKAGESVVKSKPYKAWSQIIHVATNPNSKDYMPNIDVIESWKEFEQFQHDVGEPASDTMVFTRIDKTKGFYPENCTWMTKSESSKLNAKYMKEQGLLVGRGKLKNT